MNYLYWNIIYLTYWSKKYGLTRYTQEEKQEREEEAARAGGNEAVGDGGSRAAIAETTDIGDAGEQRRQAGGEGGESFRLEPDTGDN